MFVPRYSKEQAQAAVATALTYTDVLRTLGLRPAGGNHKVLRDWLDLWGISTDHFDQDHLLRRRMRDRAIPLEEVLVEDSTYSRKTLKQRLFEEGIKARACELCGQDEQWSGRYMGLILDHINGVADDNRLGNLRIVCPNCNATLDTHCGRRNRMPVEPRQCLHCGQDFTAKFAAQRYCKDLRAPLARAT